MYLQHFNFTGLPFSIAPNPRYVYLSPQHREALAHLLYGISVGGGFVVLTGEVGTGKTTLCRCLLEQLPEDVDIALIFNPRLNARELLASICDELHIPNPGGKGGIKRFVDLLNHHLLDAHARGRRTIVLIDEAQNLSFDVLEQIRLLTNLETNESKLLQIILVGQPELNSLLARQNLCQLSQRITARYHLLPLSSGETAIYIDHRLRVSGVARPVFSRLAVRRIYRLSGGIPRLINLICDRALLGAYALGKTTVSAAIVGKAATEVLPKAQRPALKIAIVVSASLVLLLLAVGRYLDWTVPMALSAIEDTSPKPVAERKPPKEDIRAASLDPNAVDTHLPPHGGISELNSTALPPPPGKANVAADDFEKLIVDPGLTRGIAFARLFSLWGVTAADREFDECLFAKQNGLRCQPVQADHFRLVSLNHPALLELVLPDGSNRYVALTGIESGHWVLAMGKLTLKVEPARVLPFWKGRFTLLWKPPPGASGTLRFGQRNEAVRLIRHQLNQPAEGGEELLFDAKLKSRIVDFQNQHGLLADGQVGPMTMINLENAASDHPGPSLIKAHN